VMVLEVQHSGVFSELVAGMHTTQDPAQPAHPTPCRQG
jgi:hypothetical protein